MNLKDQLSEALQEIRLIADRNDGVHTLRGDVFLLDAMIVRLETEPKPTPDREWRMEVAMKGILTNARQIDRQRHRSLANHVFTD